MAYSELIKNFNRIRDYMREFYVYGFKSREEYTGKSARSYDNERRRIESWLGNHMRFRQTPDGKSVFLSIDSRVFHHNPLYTAWKAKSFTARDITLHFILFDLLSSPEESLSLQEIMEQLDRYLSEFREPMVFDESTVRKKLKEYMAEGLILAEKRGKLVYYRRGSPSAQCAADALDFFSEAAPCGVVGSYLLDKAGAHEEHFAFKHHYITCAMDSEILCQLFAAMREKRMITLKTVTRSKDGIKESLAVPLRVMISVQGGRQYLMAYIPRSKRIVPFRTDHIISAVPEEICPHFEELREKFNGMQPHIWGVNTQGNSHQRIEHVEFTVRYGEDEGHIHRRLEREKRCGTVKQLDQHSSKFSADVFDASELIPWIRTFLCRITEIHFSDAELEARFRSDLNKMYALYGLEGGDTP